MANSQIIITLNGDIGFVRIIGEGTVQNALYLKKSWQNLYAEGVNRFVFDLAECTLLDSTFLGTLLGLALKLKEARQGQLHVLNANPQVSQLLKNLGLDRLFHLGTGTDSPTSSE